MRIYPFVLYLMDKGFSVEKKLEIIHTASALTHAHMRSKIGCGIYAFVLWELLQNADKTSVLLGLHKAQTYYSKEEELSYYERLFAVNFAQTDRSEIQSSGYVVHTLEAAIWCLLTTDNYRDCVLKAVNLGLDTDTVGAVAGSLAGGLYGYEGIPAKWREELLRREYIEELCERLGVSL